MPMVSGRVQPKQRMPDARLLWGSNRIEVQGEEIRFSDEDPGFQLVFETGTLPEQRADQIVSEICENLEARTGQKAEMVKL